MLEFIEATPSPFIGNIGSIGTTVAPRVIEIWKPDATEHLPTRLEIWKVKSTPHQMLLEWSHAKGFSTRSIQIGFECIIEQSLASEVDEFVVEDIVPGYKPGADDPSIVLEAESKIVKLFQEASMTHFRKDPEVRLALRNGMFDIRFYLGKTLPFDHIVPEDYFGLDEF